MFLQCRRASCVENVGIYFITEGKYAFWNLWSLFFTLPLWIETWIREDFAFLFELLNRKQSLSISSPAGSGGVQVRPARALASAGAFQVEMRFGQKSSTRFLNVGNSYRKKKKSKLCGPNKTWWVFGWQAVRVLSLQPTSRCSPASWPSSHPWGWDLDEP